MSQFPSATRTDQPLRKQRFSTRRLVAWAVISFAVVFLLPTALTGGWWALADRPSSWSSADWSSSGILPAAASDDSAAVYLMAARTGGMKGAVAVHSWIVLKNKGAADYDRFDVVGWGRPVRENSRPADGFWYSNTPRIVHAVHGEKAEALIPRFRAAIADYAYSKTGDYEVWPGPNSNTFIAHILDEVPQFGAYPLSNAVGRDFMPGIASVRFVPATLDLRATLHGLVGFAIGWRAGIEVQFAGLVAGIDIRDPALKIPALGRVELF